MPKRKLTDEEKAQRDLKKQINQISNMMKNELSDLKEHRIPEPAYLHKVGDRIRYGRWDWTAILEILDDGKIYKCFSVIWKTKMNVPDHSDFKIHYLPWYEAKFYREEYPERFEEGDDVFISYQQRDMSSLLYRMFDKYGIDLNPDYQRGNVWTIDQKIALIDSMFKNIDIGKFSVIKRPWGSNPNKPETPLLYEMLDGKQRLTAIYEFYIGKFKYKGKYFHELHPRDQGHLKRYTINYAELPPMTNEQKYRYFLKLNTGGIPVSDDHLNKVRELWLKEKMKSNTNEEK